MNNDRRKTIKAIALRLDALRNMLDASRDDVERVRDAERGEYDSLPKIVKAMSAANAIDEAATALETAFEEMENISDLLDDVISHLSAAAGEGE